MTDTRDTPGEPAREFQRQRFAQWLAKSRAHLDELEANPPEPCLMCGHIKWPFTGLQGCWCDPADCGHTYGTVVEDGRVVCRNCHMEIVEEMGA